MDDDENAGTAPSTDEIIVDSESCEHCSCLGMGYPCCYCGEVDDDIDG